MSLAPFLYDLSLLSGDIADQLGRLVDVWPTDNFTLPSWDLLPQTQATPTTAPPKTLNPPIDAQKATQQIYKIIDSYYVTITDNTAYMLRTLALLAIITFGFRVALTSDSNVTADAVKFFLTYGFVAYLLGNYRNIYFQLYNVLHQIALLGVPGSFPADASATNPFGLFKIGSALNTALERSKVETIIGIAGYPFSTIAYQVIRIFIVITWFLIAIRAVKVIALARLEMLLGHFLGIFAAFGPTAAFGERSLAKPLHAALISFVVEVMITIAYMLGDMINTGFAKMFVADPPVDLAIMVLVFSMFVKELIEEMPQRIDSMIGTPTVRA